MRSERPLLVVGAGVKGLTLALELARAGRAVLVAERGDEVGGQGRSLRHDGFTFDLGLHAFVTRKAPLAALAREVLGEDFRQLKPRVATRLGGALVEDASDWRLAGGSRRLYELVSWPTQEWSCMRIAEPPAVIYPRRGGFGRLSEALAARARACGARILLRAGVSAEQLETRGGRVVAARLAGEQVPVEGVFWTVGREALLPPARRPAPSARLALFHFMLKGPQPLPYHWVRLGELDHPLLPPLVYYPSLFSRSSAPEGFHSAAAVIPLAAAAAVEAGPLKNALAFLGEEPAAWEPFVRRRLGEAGLLAEDRLVGARARAAALPSLEPVGLPGRLRGLSNFWEPGREPVEDAGESASALQMAAALGTARAALAERLAA